MTLRALLLALALSSLTAAPALAAEPAVQVKEIHFEEDYLLGEIAAPDGVLTESTEARDLATLVRARESFTGEMIKAVEDM